MPDNKKRGCKPANKKQPEAGAFAEFDGKNIDELIQESRAMGEEFLAKLTAEEKQRVQDIIPPGFRGGLKDWYIAPLYEKVNSYVYAANAAGVNLKTFISTVEPPKYTPPENGIGERIKLVRTRLGLNVEELARLTKEYDCRESGNGISASMLRRYEYKKGGSNPGAREICLLCDALGVTADWLVRGLKQDFDEYSVIDVRDVLRDFIRETVKPRNELRDRAKRDFEMKESMEREERLQRAKLPKK